jgi:hexosaminidase
MNTKHLAVSFALLMPLTLAASDNLNLLPQPKRVEVRDASFTISKATKIVVQKKQDRTAAEMLADELKSAAELKTQITSGAAAGKNIYLRYLAEKDFPALDGKDAELFRAEGYILDVTASRITVSGASAAGLFYGVQTLRQLVHAGAKSTATVVALHIVDWPTMQWRGVHDDISRGPIPTLDYMKKQIRTLSEYKINMFSLYMEHVFAYQKHPLPAPEEGAITADNIRELVTYAAKYHVTLLPEQQAFGHLHHVLKFEKYSDLAETPHGHVLAPVNPASYDLIRDMYAELIPLFPGPLFHIGADETFELGRGQTKARADEVGLGRVYLEHLTKVYEIVKPYNKRLMFWADIAQSYPDLLKILPKDAVAVAWAYDPRDHFDEKLKPFHDAGLSLMVSPGANNWNRMVPYYTAAYINIRNFIRDGQKYNAIGAMNTTWDDDGEALFEMTWPPLIFGAAASWQTGESSIDEFQQKYDWAFYRNSTGHQFHNAILNLSRTNDLMRSVSLNAGAADDYFWLDPFTEVGARFTQKALPAARELRLAAEDAQQTIAQNRQHARLHADTLDALTFAAQRMDFFGMKIQYAQDMSRIYWEAYENQAEPKRVNLGGITGTNAPLEDLRDGVVRLRDLYSQRWLAENKPYWLGSVTIRFDNLALEYQQKINAVRMARQQYRDTKALPTPESLGFFRPTPVAAPVVQPTPNPPPRASPTVPPSGATAPK